MLAPPKNVSVPSTRIGTPSKSENRSGTPQRAGSANRAGSRGRGMSFAQSVANMEGSKRNLRAVSARKERRWENENFLGATGLLQVSSPKEYEEMIRHGHNLLLGTREENNFREVLKADNEDLLHIFMSCQERLYLKNPNNSNGAGSKASRKRSVTKEEQARVSWNRIEKRLKDVAVKTMDRSEIIRTYVSGIEAVLLVYAQLGYAPDVPAALTDTVTVSLKPMRDKSVGILIKFEDKVENVTLYRLLLHAVCQFHGFRSQSIGKGNSRVTLIHNPDPIAIDTVVSENGVVQAVTGVSSTPSVDELKISDIRLSVEDDYVVVGTTGSSIANPGNNVPSSESVESSVPKSSSSHRGAALVNMSLLTYLRLSGLVEDSCKSETSSAVE